MYNVTSYNLPKQTLRNCSKTCGIHLCRAGGAAEISFTTDLRAVTDPVATGVGGNN